MRFARRFWPVFGLAVAGVLALGALPPPGHPEGLPAPLRSLSPLALRTLLVANPLVLAALAALVGAALAHRVGFGSHVAGTWRGGERAELGFAVRSLTAAAVMGVLLGLALVALDLAIAPLVDSPSEAPGLLVGMLYGGLTEEVLMRWGLMSLVAWLLTRVTAHPDERTASGPGLSRALAWASIATAALVFGLAHLPALAQQLEPSTALVARTVALNAAGGLLYGWLFWRRSLEAAMAAHASTHAGFALARAFAG